MDFTHSKNNLVKIQNLNFSLEKKTWNDRVYQELWILTPRINPISISQDIELHQSIQIKCKINLWVDRNGRFDVQTIKTIVITCLNDFLGQELLKQLPNKNG